MAFEKILVEADKESKFWTPKTEGEYIEGNVYGDAEDNFGNRQIVLDRGEDEHGNLQLTTLPGHHNLKRYYSSIKDGDYIRVTLTKIQPSKNDDKRQYMVYSVEIDPDRFKEYDN